MSKRIHSSERAADSKSAALWGGLSFALPAAVMAALLAVYGIAPFGDGTLITENGAAWFESFVRLYDEVVSGEGVFYHLNVGYGSSFYSEFAAGLCSPFLFFALFFGSKHLAAAYSFITVLRTGASGLTAWWMLRKCAAHSRPFSFALACGYALGGFTACAAYYPSIADAAVFFPLLAMGIYGYVYESRPLKLFLFGALFFLTSPRLAAVGLLLSFVLYAVFYFRRGVARQRYYKLAMFAATVFCAALSSAVLVIPMGASAVYYKNGAFASVKTSDLLAALCFGGYGTVCRKGGYGLCIAGLLLMGLAAFLLHPKIPRGERIALGVGMAVILTISAVPWAARFLLGFGMYGEETVNIGFMWALLAVYAAARYFGDSGGRPKWTVPVGIGVYMLTAILSGALRGENRFALLAEFGLAVLLAAVFVKLSLHTVHSRESEIRLTALTAAGLVLFGMLHCGAAMGGIRSEWHASALEKTAERRSEIEKSLAGYAEDDKESMRFFRRRSTDGVSDGADLRRNEISGLTAFAARLGVMEHSEYGGADNFTPLTDRLFGIGCVIDEKGGVSYRSDEVQSPAFDIFRFDESILGEGNPFEVQNAIAKSWFGVSDFFVPVAAQMEWRDSSADNEKYKWTFDNETTEIKRYAVELAEGDRLYLLAEEGNYSYAVEDDSRSNWHKACAGGVYAMTQAEKTGTVTVYLCADADEGVPKPTFAVIQPAAYDALQAKFALGGAKYISRRGSRISFMLYSMKNNVAVTSIPYEYGWEVRRNGKTVEPVKLFDGLIGVELESGANSIVMTYRPPFFRVSAIFSAVMLLLGAYITLRTEQEAARRRKVRMAFRAVELNLSRTGSGSESAATPDSAENAQETTPEKAPSAANDWPQTERKAAADEIRWPETLQGSENDENVPLPPAAETNRAEEGENEMIGATMKEEQQDDNPSHQGSDF